MFLIHIDVVSGCLFPLINLHDASFENVCFVEVPTLFLLSTMAERYDEMAEHMKEVGEIPQELSVEERNLLSVAYKNTVGSRRAAWRIITSIEHKEKLKGNNNEQGAICSQILELLNGNLPEKASTDELKVFYHKMKADY